MERVCDSLAQCVFPPQPQFFPIDVSVTQDKKDQTSTTMFFIKIEQSNEMSELNKTNEVTKFVLRHFSQQGHAQNNLTQDHISKCLFELSLRINSSLYYFRGKQR